MDKSWEGILKLGIVHFMAFPETLKGEGPILETVTKIAEDAFFTAIEVTWMKEADVRKKARDVLEASHLTVYYGAQPPLLIGNLDLNSPEEEERIKAIDQVKDCINEAEEMGAKRVAVLSGPDPGDARRAQARDFLIQSLKEICAYGEEKGIGITLETFDRDVDKRRLVGPCEEAAAIAEEVREDFPSFGIMYDLSHLPLLEEKPLEALSALKDHLVHIHIGNCVISDPSHPAYGDTHPRFGIEGGENDVPQLVEFLRALFEVGYLTEEPRGESPIVAFEVKPLPGESSGVVIASAKRVWKEAWARL
jgi:sugar phosphate isomerase/epimerase